MVLTRESYFKEIGNNLALLQQSIEFRTASNLHDLGILAEDFVKDLLNIVFDFQLENLNSINSNQAGIDVGDTLNKVAVQVTSTTSRQKVKTTIDKFISHKLYEKYSRLYVFILKGKQQSSKKFDTQGCFDFQESDDITDFKVLLTKIQCLETEKLQQIWEFVDREMSTTKREDRTGGELDHIDYIPDRSHTWQHQPFLAHYVNVHRLLNIAASSGIRVVDIPAKNLDDLGSIRALPYDDYHALMACITELLQYWNPKVLNLQNASNLTKDFIGCTFEFFQTDFKSKNVKFWNKYDEKPKTHRIYKKDPHLYLEVEDVKLYLPLNLAWMTTDTSYHNFGVQTGIADSLSGLCILKSLSKDREAVFTPLVIGVHNTSQSIENAVQRGERSSKIRQSW
ncbi:SMEK domain-containing protein [Phormidesmis priestleyi]